MLLWVEVTLHFFDMTFASRVSTRHRVATPWFGLVVLGGSGHSFSFALTSLLAMLSVLLRLRHGLGTIPFSWSLGLRTVLIESTSRSGEYLYPEECVISLFVVFYFF